jgi:uncharacterized protein with PQ loop repeat
MAPQPIQPSAHTAVSEKMLRRVLGAMSIFTIVMTVPQVWTIWVDHQAAGVSVLSWSAYLLSALLWFWHGLRERDRNIYLPCIAWIAADGAVIVGAVLYG